MWSVQGREAVTRLLADRGARPDLFTAAVLDDAQMARDILQRDPTAIGVVVRFGQSHPHLGGGDKYVWALDFADRPLEVARRRGHRQVFELLMARSPAPLQLLKLCREGDIAGIRDLLDEAPDLLDSLDEDAVCDVLCGAAQATTELLGRGLDPDARDMENGATALHNAAWKGRLIQAKVLLAHGADPSIRDRTYDSPPLGWALENGQEEVARLLRDAAGD